MFPCAGAAGLVDIEVNSIVADFDRISGEATADRRTGGRAIGEVEAAVVLGTLDDATFHKTLGEVVVAVGANTIRRIKTARCIADQGEGFPAMVESKDILLAEIGLGTNLHPALGVRLGIARDEALHRTLLRRREDALHMIGRVFFLTNDGWQNLAPSGEDRWIWRRAVVLDERMELVKGMERHEREHVVLHMVVHVPVDEPADRVHVDGAAVQAVVEDILGEARVLGRILHDHQPSAEKVRQDDQENRRPTVNGDRKRNRRRVDRYDDAGVARDF